MSKKYDDFMKELEELFEKHKVYLCASEYDSLQVRDASDGDAFDYDCFDDMTKDIDLK